MLLEELNELLKDAAVLILGIFIAFFIALCVFTPVFVFIYFFQWLLGY